MAERAGYGAGVWSVDKLIRAYQVVLRPLVGPSCRYAPSCSEYARDAVRRYGVAVGGRLAMKRLLRCHPLAAGGWDPVPERLD